MNDWQHSSLAWIHRVRREHYERTKDIPLKEVIQQSVRRTRELVDEYSNSEE